MGNSIKDIINGQTPIIAFEKVSVEKCTYISREEETTELLPIWNQASALLMCGGGTYHFRVFDNLHNLDVPFAHFSVNAPFFYRQDSWGEMAQINLVSGNEIQMLRPLVIPNPVDNNCEISLFSMTRQNGNLIFFMLLNPTSTDDYYFRIRFSEQ